MASRQTYSTAAENSSQSSSQSLSSARSSVSSTLASTSIEALSIMANASNSTYIGVHLDNSETIIHPNKIIRGTVRIITSKVIHASQIRIKFRCIERAIVKVKDADSFSKLNRIETVSTTYFDVETNVWGIEPSAYSINGWETIEPGQHEFKFALKAPNVNFLPSTETPIGFSIRYLWTAFIDGPANHPTIRSDDLITSYRPLICCPSSSTPCTFQETLFSGKQAFIASIIVDLPVQVFYPEQQFSLDVALTSIATGMTITGISYKLRQHYQGQVQLPKGIAHRCFYRDIMRRTLPMPSETKVTDTELRLSNVDVTIPSVWVSPCFSSNLIRMYYTFVIVVHVLTPGFFGTVEQVQVEIPIGMANMDQSQWARVHAIQDYRQSLDAPFFFDPLLNEPSTTCEDEAAAAAGLFEVDTGPSPTSTSTDAENNDTLPPPSYASLQQDHQQRLQHQASIMKRKRIEKTRYSSRWVKPDMMPELGQALIVEPVLYDEY